MIYIGADHRGFRLKEEIKKWLMENHYESRDLGANEYDKEDDYTDIAIMVGEKVVGDNGKGVVICGSGAGASIAANKVRGVRAGLCTSEKQAKAARNDDDVNLLCLSADAVSVEDNIRIVEIFLETLFSSEERYIRRINKIKEYETEISK
ncbi:RpiB/LacA/LacB family sugar-phosphate isomerase [Candidatus Shapirobacteria bacterium]|nr:RpiB/LacA/LacB family sugar-phosphate isomerase [Candidatus Shapirobacteria bacterium]